MPYTRKLASGKWQATIRTPKGKRLTYVSPLKAEAKEWGLQQEARIRRGDWHDRSLGKVTVAEFHARWRTSRTVSPVTDRGDRSGHERILAQWGHEQIRAIGHLEIQAWIRQLHAAGVGQSAIRRTFNLFRGMMSDAIEDGILTADPCRRIRGVSDSRRQPRFYTHEEAAAIVAVMDEPAATMTLLMFWCGLRWGEAAALRGEDVDWLRRRIRIDGTLTQNGVRQPTAKTASSRVEIPAPQNVLDALSRIVGPDSGGLIFRTRRQARPLSGSNWRANHWHPAVEQAGVRKLGGPHVCRHTAASWLVQSGVPLVEVQRILRHDSYQTTLRYAHLAPDVYDVVSDAWDRMPQIVDAPVTLRPVRGGKHRL